MSHRSDWDIEQPESCMSLADGHPIDLEALTQSYGHDIFSRLVQPRPLPLGPRWWDDRFMAWTMADEAVKVQLFRFVDVLPMLHNHEDVNRHLREYFEEALEHLPRWLRPAVRHVPQRGLAGALLARTATRSAERLARRFIAGSNLTEALTSIESLRRRSLGFTVDLLGEATITETEADRYQAEYFQLVAGLGREVNSLPAVALIDEGPGGPIPRVNISIKLSSLYSQFDPIDPEGTSRAVLHRLLPILRLARENGAFINVDMEQYAYKDLTLRIFRDILQQEEFRSWPDVGIAIQSYLRDCLTDLEELARWAQERGTPIGVRLVKGAYWDYETVLAAQQGWSVPVFTDKSETDVNFERATRFILEQAAWLRPAIGSHNIRSIAHAMACAKVLNLPPGTLEIQMLYGMADPIKEALVALGQRVRVYTPYGELLPGMAYLVRRLLENTANESFLRASFMEHVSEDQLLMNPLRKLVRGEASGGRRGQASGGREPPVEGPFLDHSTPFQNEPPADFSREDARHAMQAALEDVKRQFGKSYPLVIGGQAITAAAFEASLNPSHVNQVIGRWCKATVPQAKQALQSANDAFPAWRDTAAQDRAGYLFRAADVMRRRRYELAAWEVYECGKQWREADADVAEAIDYCEYYGREMLRLAAPIHHDVPGEENAYCYEPRGVVVVIAPWNFPLAILCGMSTAALVTGNTVILKPAEQSTVVAAKLMEVLQEVQLPAGVVNFLPGIGEEIGPTLIQHPSVAMIAFTGSRGVGLLINREGAEVAAGQEHVKRVLAEMGGKNAIIIDQDADLDEAVRGLVASAFGYQGQKCSACSRAIVLESIYDTFLARLIEATRSLVIAPAEHPASAIGPLIDAEARRRVLEYIEIGKQEARLVYAADVGSLAGGGREPPVDAAEGYYVGPHIFADVPPAARIAQEEIFGPVLAVLKARDLTHALEIAVATPYALTGGIYSRSPENIARARREFRVGNLYINRKITGALVERQPFGGFKLSGIGSKAGGPDYLLQFLLPRAITENTMRRGFAPAAQHEAL
jgi:RHH-type transcriptional regulator, proline utilization regulon repressor / proline dehydrogenase / delta 1-pyrroline-5-carboxylate dehydrogenase